VYQEYERYSLPCGDTRSRRKESSESGGKVCAAGGICRFGPRAICCARHFKEWTKKGPGPGNRLPVALAAPRLFRREAA
ncbi:hypothetical protein K0M31_010832, partial [Melipona bicolor]